MRQKGYRGFFFVIIIFILLFCTSCNSTSTSIHESGDNEMKASQSDNAISPKQESGKDHTGTGLISQGQDGKGPRILHIKFLNKEFYIFPNCRIHQGTPANITPTELQEMVNTEVGFSFTLN